MAVGAIGEDRVMQHDEEDHEDAQIVEGREALRGGRADG
jgi:hypothetical protein